MSPEAFRRGAASFSSWQKIFFVAQVFWQSILVDILMQTNFVQLPISFGKGQGAKASYTKNDLQILRESVQESR